MINLDKYKYTGWTLSRLALEALQKIINDKKIKRVIEFGSGQSTYLLEDMGVEYISFDHDLSYAAKTDNVIISELIQINDLDFNNIINGKVLYKDVLKNTNKPSRIHTRMKNCFYNISPDCINGLFDLVILDGPNGNGRSVSFEIIKKHLSPNGYFFIDDYNHYPFIDHLKLSFPEAELIDEHSSNGDNWQLYKI